MPTTRSWLFSIALCEITWWLCCSPLETVMLLAWRGECRNMEALGWHWITSQGDGESYPAELGGTFQNHAPEPNWNAGAGAPYGVCTDVKLLQQIKLPSARMKSYFKNASSCKLALLLPPCNEALANHLRALQFTCTQLCTHIWWSLQLKQKKINTSNTCTHYLNIMHYIVLKINKKIREQIHRTGSLLCQLLKSLLWSLISQIRARYLWTCNF